MKQILFLVALTGCQGGLDTPSVEVDAGSDACAALEDGTECKTAVDALTTSVVALQGTVITLQTTLAAQQDTITTLQGSLTAAEETIAALQLQADATEDAVYELPSYSDEQCIAAIQGTTLDLASGTTVGGEPIAAGDEPVQLVDVAECEVADAGTLRFNGTDFQGCNGQSWMNLGAIDSSCLAAMYFQGGGYIEVPQDADFVPGTDDWTIELWAKLDSADQVLASTTTVGVNNMWKLEYGGPGLVFLMADEDDNLGSATAIGDLADGGMHHLAGVREGSELRVYVDGVLMGTGDAPTGAVTPTGTFAIGRDPNAPSWYANGIIDGVRVWRRAVYDGNFQPNRCGTADGAGLVVDFPFTADSGAITYDASGNGHVGVLNGNVSHDGP